MRSRTTHQILLIGLSAAVLIAGCWNAPFIAYDDPAHVTENSQVLKPLSSFEWIKFNPHLTWLPATILSYKFDLAVFGGAPGIRFMSLIYHIGAALILWRVLLRLKLSENRALFIAWIFAVHPMACESVCWISERKTVLAGLFSFATLWAWIAFPSGMKRIAISAVLYALALMSKPSALGMLPIIVLYEFFGGIDGLRGERDTHLRNPKSLALDVVRTLPLSLLAAACLIVNTMWNPATTINKPPGGSIFTALLTDLEIVSRYIANSLVPIKLSAIYFVEPVVSVFDSRVAIYGSALLAGFALSLVLSKNRRIVLFAWLWIVGALGPNLNLVSIAHLMQDRYFYLSMPAVFIIACEMLGGLLARIATINPRTPMLAGGGYLLTLALLANFRSAAWFDMHSIFLDAVEKQPRASNARYGLGSVYGERWQQTSDPKEEKVFRQAWLEQWRVGVDLEKCPDAVRYSDYARMCFVLGNESARDGDFKTAEKYWLAAAHPPPEMPDVPALRADALRALAAMMAKQGRAIEAAKYAYEAQKIARPGH